MSARRYVSGQSDRPSFWDMLIARNLNPVGYDPYYWGMILEWSVFQQRHFLDEAYGTSKHIPLELIQPVLPPISGKGLPPHVLDLGMNGGYLVERLVNMGYDAHGADLSGLVKKARELLPHLAERFWNCNLEYDDLPGQGWDLILALGVMEHLLRYDLLFGKCGNALKKGGTLFVTTCCRRGVKHEFYHTHHFVEEELTEMATAAGLEVVGFSQTSPTNLLGTFRSVV